MSIKCSIHRDGNNNITRVTLPNGEESTLFGAIRSIPNLSQEQALNAYMKIEDIDSNSIKRGIEYRDAITGEVVNTYKDALGFSKINVRVANTTVATINPTFDIRTPQGFVNSYIKEGLLQDTTKVRDGIAYYQPYGNGDSILRATNSSILNQDLFTNIGIDSKAYFTKNGILVEGRDTSRNLIEDGILERKGEDLPKGTPRKVPASMEKLDSILPKEFVNFFNRVRSSGRQKLTRKEIESRLQELLRDMGVSQMSLDEYQKKHNIKTSTVQDVNALADITNQVIAFKEGQITLENLAEETVHFIIEAIDSNTIAEILPDVALTDAYSKYAEQYRQKYSEVYKGDKLETAVRKEILGKIVAESIVDNAVDVDSNLLTRVREMITNFISRLFNPSSVQASTRINQLVDYINDSLISDQLFDDLLLRSNSTEPVVFYSLNSEQAKNPKKVSEIQKVAESTVSSLNTALRQLQYGGQAFTATIDRLETVHNELVDQSVSGVRNASMVEVVSVVAKLADYLDTTISSRSRPDVLSPEAFTAIQILNKELRPLLVSIREYYKTTDNNIYDITDSTIRSIDVIASSIDSEIDAAIDSLVVDIMNRHNLDEHYREYVGNWMKTAYKDTSFLQSKFGTIGNSRDPLLAAASFLGERINNDSRKEFVHKARMAQEALVEAGVSPKDLTKLYMNDGYLIDRIDRGAQDRALREIMARSYILASREIEVGALNNQELQALMDHIPKPEVDGILEKMRKRDLDDLSREKQGVYDEINRRARNSISERPFTDEYYIMREQKDKDARISEATVRRRNKYSQDRFMLNKDAYVTRGGKVFLDYSKLSEESRQRLQEISRERASDKSVYTAEGTLKPGIQKLPYSPENSRRIREAYKKGTVVQYVEVGGNVFFMELNNTASESGRIALDLQVLDQQYLEEVERKGGFKEGQVTQEFLDEFRNQKDNESKLAFLRNNLTINFSQRFWDSLDSSNSIIEVAKANNIGIGFVESLERMQAEKRAILSQFRDTTTPYEIMADRMFPSTKDRLDEIDSDVRALRSSLAETIRLEGIETSYTHDSETKTEPNRALLNEFRVSGEKDFGLFLQSKLPLDDRWRLAKFISDIELIGSGNHLSVSESSIRLYEEYLEEGLTPQEMAVRYSTRYLPSYYTRFVPTNSTTDIDAIFSDNAVADRVLESLMRNPNVTLRPNFSYMEDSNQSEYTNIKFNPEDGGMFQSKEGLFRNDKYYQMFQPDKNGNATTNKGLFTALEILKDMKRDINESMGIRTDIYKVPQVHQRGVDRVFQAFQNFSGQRFKQELQNFAMYRVDDVEYGQQVADVATVPHYYVRNIEDTKEISGELFTTYMMMLQQATLSKHRKENLGRFMAINDQILRRGSVKGKEALSSSTYQMFKNYMDYSLYGIKESVELRFSFLGQEYDFTKMARFIQSSLIFRNLSLTPIVPLTSMFTQEIQYRIDRFVGEIVQQDSARLATKEFGRLAGHSIRDIGNVRTTSELNILMESLGVRNVEDRYSNSSYNKLLRNAPKVSMGLHQIASFPTNERIALSVLYDYRVVDGRIYNFNQFKRKETIDNPSITDIEIKSKWRDNESNAVRNYLDARVDEGAVWTDEVKSLIKPPNGQTVEQYLDDKFGTIQDAATNAVSRLDTLITQSQRTQAQRHFGWSFLMTHMSWLVIGTSARFKSAQRNLNSGQIEEGSYRTTINFLGDVVRSFREDGVKAFAREWTKPGRLLAKEMGYSEDGDNRQLEHDLVQLRQKAIKRVAIDTAVAVGLMLASSALMDLADDEENEDIFAIQMGNYLMLRVLHETLSNQSGIGQQWWNVLNEPIVGLRNYKSMFNLPINLMFGDEVIESGFYEGYTKRMRELHRTVPFIKPISDMSRLKDVSEQYYYFNSKNIRYSGIGVLYTDALRAEEEERERRSRRKREN